MAFHESVQDQIWLRVTEVFFSRIDLFACLTIRAQHRFSLCIFLLSIISSVPKAPQNAVNPVGNV